MINQNIVNKEISDLCLTVNNEIQTGNPEQNRNFMLEVLNKGNKISKRVNRMFMSSNNPVIYGDLYVYRHSDNIIKIANCDCDQYIAEFDIVREIAMQKYASTLQTKCDFKVPLIINYGKVVIDRDYGKVGVDVKDNEYEKFRFKYNCLYYFTMENITAKTLREYLATIDFDTRMANATRK